MRMTTRLLILAALAATPVAAQDASHPPHHFFELGDFTLESGETLEDARVLYVTHGSLNADRSNAVLVPSWYGGNHHGYDFLVGPDAALDPTEYFVIVTEMFGSGGSSSPSNMPPGASHDDFPPVTIRDNVRATHRLVTERFGLTQLRAIIGFSMGAQQAFQWAVSYPDFMDLIVPIAGTAKTYPHGIVRLESALTLITHDPSMLAGHDTLSTAGTRAWALHWQAWTRSTEWWRLERERAEVLAQMLDPAFATHRSPSFRPHDQVLQGRAWQRHDVGDTPGFGGDVERALASIRARVLYLPGATDMYFPLTDAEYERRFIPDVDFRPIPSIWGHTAGAGPNEDDRTFINEAIRDALP
jgi:homoserine O-acetyltransferase/O-succinyltransferase